MDLTPVFNRLGKDNWQTREETFKFWDLVHLMLFDGRFHIRFGLKVYPWNGSLLSLILVPYIQKPEYSISAMNKLVACTELLIRDILRLCHMKFITYKNTFAFSGISYHWNGAYYKIPLHLDVIDLNLQWIRDTMLPDEAPSSLESFYPLWVTGIIPHNQGVVDSLCHSPVKGYFKK